MDYQEACKEYFKKLKKNGNPWCSYCFDDRGKLKKESNDKWICEDCIYMNNLLNEIKNIG